MTFGGLVLIPVYRDCTSICSSCFISVLCGHFGGHFFMEEFWELICQLRKLLRPWFDDPVGCRAEFVGKRKRRRQERRHQELRVTISGIYVED